MDRAFWLARWEEGRIGFHRGEVHPDLRQFLDTWLDEPHHRVLVPLCGKTLDIPFLAGRGHEVTGVEISPQAVAELHRDQRLRAWVDEDGPFKVHSSPGITIYEGDFFDLGPELVGTFDRVWDRAALVAMSPEHRPAYVARLRTLLRPGARILLDTAAYEQDRMSGPPWSVPGEELESLYEGCTLELLQEREAIEEVGFGALGLSSWLARTTLIRLPG